MYEIIIKTTHEKALNYIYLPVISIEIVSFPTNKMDY